MSGQGGAKAIVAALPANIGIATTEFIARVWRQLLVDDFGHPVAELFGAGYGIFLASRSSTVCRERFGLIR
jgi:hypothetical protein